MAASRALVIGATGGIGAALLAALEDENAVGVGRTTQPGLNLTDEASIAEAAGCLLPLGPFDRIVVATGALTFDGRGPEKRLTDLDAGVMARAFALNAIGPALLIKHFVPLLPSRGRCVMALLSARVGSIGDNRLGGWYSYRASKAALNQIVRTAAVEVARKRPEALLLALHPGTVRTGLSANLTAPDQGMMPGRAAACLIEAMNTATRSGTFLDYTGASVPW